MEVALKEKNHHDIIAAQAEINSVIAAGLEEIVKETGIPRRTVDRLISRLKEDRVLERVGSRRSGHWVLHL